MLQDMGGGDMMPCCHCFVAKDQILWPGDVPIQTINKLVIQTRPAFTGET